ncbi:MAG: DNA polymerase III subunit beta [Holosporales bacterium]|jgi:DNA polymerase-3 subunit beta|nr:DNA polymerase III subunit beta [Holosporales bacterium]
MRFTLSRGPLFTAVTSAHGVAERKPAVPVLSHVLLEAAGDQVTLRATDLDHTFVARIEASVEAPGSAIVLAQTLYDALRKTGEVETLDFSIKEEGSSLFVKAGRSRFNLAMLQGVPFPEEGTFTATTSFSLSSTAIKQLLDKTRFSISMEETRYALNGIYLHTNAEGNALCAAATDSHRLAVTSVPCAPQAALSLILSRKTIAEMVRLFDQPKKDVLVEVSPTQIRFDCKDQVLTARLVDGAFPEYTRVIPERGEIFFDIDRRRFIESVDRASIIADETVRIVKLKVQEGILLVSSLQHELGAAEDEVDIAYTGSTPWEAGFNARYLLEAAEHVNGDMVRIYVVDALAPILVESPGNHATSFVVMPMRV